MDDYHLKGEFSEPRIFGNVDGVAGRFSLDSEITKLVSDPNYVPGEGESDVLNLRDKTKGSTPLKLGIFQLSVHKVVESLDKI